MVLTKDYSYNVKFGTVDGVDISKSLTIKLRDKNNDSNNVSQVCHYEPLYGYRLMTANLDYGDYVMGGSAPSISVISVHPNTLYVVQNFVLKSSGLTKVYGKSNKLSVTLADDRGNRMANCRLTVKLNGKTATIKTDSKGRASISVNLEPKKYVATIKYVSSGGMLTKTINVNVVIKKANPVRVAKKKTFKVKTKIKKYTITLKNNLGKVMKNTKVSLKVRGKTFTAKTNSKGAATFKITNLKKKGSFKTTITYSGNKYYNRVTKSVKITVKK